MSEVVTDPAANEAGSFSLDFTFAQGKPCATAVLREQPEDFKVDEELGIELSGEGEHVYLQLEKKNLNTLDVVDQIARLAKVKRMDVGYAGLKDRRAVTSQWFSVYLPVNKQVPWLELNTDNVRLLKQERHKQKLRRGQHKCNCFCIRLRSFKGDISELERRLIAIREQGVPNYFGPQRFGINGNNLLAADKLLRKESTERNRKKRGIYISAARSYLFNTILSERVKETSWRDVETGDIAFEGLNTDAAPTGPLWGRGRLQTTARVLDLETQLSERHNDWCSGLEHVGLKQERRSLLLALTDMEWEISNKDQECILELRFSLPPGSYATSVIRELCETHTVV